MTAPFTGYLPPGAAMDFTTLPKLACSDWAVVMTSFVIACVLSGWPGNQFIQMVFHLMLSHRRGPGGKGTMKEFLNGLKEDPQLAAFRAETSRTIGSLERVIYIFAIMFGLFPLITGVLILKAFYGWTDKSGTAKGTDESGTAKPSEEEMEINAMHAQIAHFHTYIIGNFLSVMVAMLFGFLALYTLPKGLTKIGLTCTQALTLCSVTP
jgi:hypothetical protein